MKYLVKWEGVVTGSIGGRDDGYPETKTAVVDERSLLNYKNIKGLEVYEIAKLAESTVKQLLKNLEDEEERKNKEKQRLKDSALKKLTPIERSVLGLTRFGNTK